MKIFLPSTCRIILFCLFFDQIRTLKGDEEYDGRAASRKKRYLVYPNPLDSETKVQVLFGLGLPMESTVSTILGYVLKCNYNLPYNASALTQPYVRYQRNIHNNDRYLSRWSLYRLLQTSMEMFGSGRVCLLRAVCEASETPFEQSHGLLGEILNVILLPSSTSEEYEFHEDHEYHRAELIGKEFKGACSRIFSECTKSPLDYFTYS